MKVKFNLNTEPCIVYEIKDATEVMEYAESLGKYCPHIELEVLGLVPKELLSEAADHQHNITAIDLAIELSK